VKVLVVYNEPLPGQSDAHLCHSDVLEEVEHVTTALQALGYSYSALSIGKDMRSELVRLAYAGVDCVFNLCESILEQSRLQPCFAGFLELLGIPFTGASACGLHNAMDKQVAKALLLQAQMPTPHAWKGGDLLAALCSATHDMAACLPLPLIVKPSKEDGSIGISQASVATTPQDLRVVLEKATQKHGADGVLVEQYIPGSEFCVGFLGNENPQAFPLIEYSFDAFPEGYYPIRSYESKWDVDSVEKRSIKRLYPARISAGKAAAVVATCKQVWRIMRLTGYGRIDIRCDARSNDYYVIDVNANPGIRPVGDFAFGASHAGIAYPELIDRILRLALEQATATPKPEFFATPLAKAE
jgi:D-alanine-D-alanine ligase